MANFTYTLEKYRGTNTRHTCPNCNVRREFSRYVDASGNYLSDDVGKCNRESKCSYHKTPKEYFADNPTAETVTNRHTKKKENRNSAIYSNPKGLSKIYSQICTLKKESLIKSEYLNQTLTNYERNSFVRFLSNLFCDEPEAVQKVIERYLIGTWKDGLTVFWQIDQSGRIRTGKIMRYDARSGKRQTVRTWIQDGETCELKTDWMHTKIKKDFRLKQCFFGEHLLRKEPGKTVAVVEAEKTALICAICFPEILWLAIGAKGYLTLERFQVLRDRKVLLYPDADAYANWKEKALKAQRNGFNVRISSLIESKGTSAEKKDGFDLADYLINELTAINEYNGFVDSYNAKLDEVLRSAEMRKDFETILDEQRAILIINGGLSEEEAEACICGDDNIRRIVFSL